MSRILAAVLLLLVVVIGLGYYRDWFHVSTDHTERKTDVRITVDKDKVQSDADRAKEKVQELEQDAKDKLRPHQP
jgi:uncharacterized protein YxeA